MRKIKKNAVQVWAFAQNCQQHAAIAAPDVCKCYKLRKIVGSKNLIGFATMNAFHGFIKDSGRIWVIFEVFKNGLSMCYFVGTFARSHIINHF